MSGRNEDAWPGVFYPHWRDDPDISGMDIPVACGFCGEIYDLAVVKVTARYSDCSVWTTPCCRRAGVDDRPAWGTGRRSYRELRR